MTKPVPVEGGPLAVEVEDSGGKFAGNFGLPCGRSAHRLQCAGWYRLTGIQLGLGAEDNLGPASARELERVSWRRGIDSVNERNATYPVGQWQGNDSLKRILSMSLPNEERFGGWWASRRRAGELSVREFPVRLGGQNWLPTQPRLWLKDT